MQNYTSKNRLSQKFGVKNYSEDRTSVEVVGRVGVNTNEAVQALDVIGTVYVSNDVGIGTTNVGAVVPQSNTSKLAVGIVTANFYYGDGSNLKNIDDVGLAKSLSRNGQGQLLFQSANNETSLLSSGSVGEVLISQGPNNPPAFGAAAPAGAVEGFLLFDEGLQVGGGQTFSGLNIVGAAVTVVGTEFGGIATVTVNQKFAEVAGFASDSKVAGIASDAERVRLSDLNDNVQVFIPFSTEATGVTTINTNQNLTFNPNSGLLTATKFSGIGSDIKDLNASELKFGTIPDEVFPENLPANVIVGFAASAGIATTSISAGVANTANILKLEDESIDDETFITFANDRTGDQRLKTNSNLTFNSSTGILSATKIAGDGNLLTNLNLGTITFATKAGTATSAEGLTTARNIFGIPFTGTANTDASGSSLNVQGSIINVDGSITGKNSDLTIQPKNSPSSRDIIIRGNDNTSANQSGGNVIIGDPGRGEIRFKSNIRNGFQFFKPGDNSISANLDTFELTEDQNFKFPNNSGTFALLKDIQNGTAKEALTLRTFNRTDNLDYQLIFINEGATGLGTTVFSNSQIKYNPGQDVLTAGKFSGIGSLITELDAGKIDRGTLNTVRLPDTYRKNASIKIDADGEISDLSLFAGKNLIIRSGLDTTNGGIISFQGNGGDLSYKFLNPNDFDQDDTRQRKAILDCTQVLTGQTNGNVFFTFPGNKTGSGNTFAMLDDITEGTAGVAKTAENLKIIGSGDFNGDRFPILSSSDTGGVESSPIVDQQLKYNPSTNVLTAGGFTGVGSSLTDLDASNVGLGTLSTARLPNVIRIVNDITIDADGATSNLNLDSGNNILLTAGKDITGPQGGKIVFKGKGGEDSYRFTNTSNTSKTANLSFEDILNGSGDNNVTFKLPGNKTGTGNTFAMLDDLTGENGGGVTVGTAKSLENDVTINFVGDTVGVVTFNGSEDGPISVSIGVTAKEVKIDDISSDTPPDQNLYITFVDTDGDGNRALKIDNNLQYNQDTNILNTKAKSATDADNADKVDIVNFNSDGADEANDYNVYFGGPGVGNNSIRKDDDFRYKSVHQVLKVPNISASGIVTATDFNSTSDIKLKTNIERISDPIEKVLQIDGVSFNWIGNGRPSLGVIADNVQEILPEIVTDGDPKTVNYNGLIGLLIEAVKEQHSEINSLKERLSKLE